MVSSDQTEGAEVWTALKKVLKRVLKQLGDKLEKQNRELDESEKALWYRQMGDSLLANPSGIGRGTTTVTVFNVHTQQEQVISLNPKLDCRGNAELFYKKARKAERGAQINREKVAETQQEIEIGNRLCSRLDGGAPTDPAVAEILRNQIERYLSKHAPNELRAVVEPEKKCEPPIPYRHFEFGEWQVFIGKNDRQNDELTTRFARPSDIWLHVAGHPGSHVVIRKPEKSAQLPPSVLEQAASLAVWFSQAKHTSYAEVHYTEARFVRKRRHAPPGEVVLDRYKSIRVAPRSPHDLFPSRYGKVE